MNQTILGVALLMSLSMATKVLLINDVHLDINSTMLYSEPGTEASVSTMKKVFEQAAQVEAKMDGDIEAILLAGDLCRHGLAAKEGSATNNWEEMKKTMRTVMDSLVEQFPDIPIIPVIGNNDVMYHDQAPSAEQKDQYYQDLWEIWFEDITANAAIAADDTIKSTFLNGGYYAYELADDIIVLALNGMYPFYENFEDQGMSDVMIDWVQEVLEANPDKSFITLTHVFYGNNFYMDLEVLWNSQYTNKLLKILQQHQDRMILGVGAHIHHVQIMAPISEAVPDLDIVQIISPAVSPIYMNNPGYGSLKMSAEKGIEEIIFRFF